MVEAYDVERLIEKLTEGQKRALIGAPMLADGRVLLPTFLGSLNHADGWPSGMIEYYSAYYAALTPLGLAARTTLERTAGKGVGNG